MRPGEQAVENEEEANATRVCQQSPDPRPACPALEEFPDATPIPNSGASAGPADPVRRKVPEET